MPGELKPLEGTTVLDLTRMLPGAVLARQLLDLGARVIKVEDPQGGDLFRHAPPLADGIGVGFSMCYRGAESVALDLRESAGAESVARLSRRADVLLESFRTGRMESWGLGPDRLTTANPRLVYCSLSATGRTGPEADGVAHDLNATARTGGLAAMDADGLPLLQLADVGTALLAFSAVLAALLHRERTGMGAVLDQPLVTGPLPFVSWLMAEAACGGTGTIGMLLSGACPHYRTYRCGDGFPIAVATLEPRFWHGFLEMLELSELESSGYDSGEAGRAAAHRIQEVLATGSRAHWLEQSTARGLPISPVATPGEAANDPLWAALALTERPGVPPSRWFLPPLGGLSAGRVPEPGEHTQRVLEELGREE